MKKIIKEYEVYEFKELNKKAKEKAIEDFRLDPYEEQIYWECITDDDGAFEFDESIKQMLDFFGVKPSTGDFFNGNVILELFIDWNNSLEFKKDITEFEDFLKDKNLINEDVLVTEERLTKSVKDFLEKHQWMPDDFIIGEFEALEVYFEKDGTKFKDI